MSDNNDDVLNMASEDAEKKEKLGPTDEELQSVSALAERQVALINEVEAAEAALDEKKKELKRVQEIDLPEAIDKTGLKKIELKDGTKISVETIYAASIPEERKPEAFKWLDDQGHGGLIKADVKASFGKAEIEKARSLYEKIKELGFEADFVQSVHWQTLRAFIKEQIETGATLPLDLFGVFIGKKAKVVLPKTK